MDKTEMTIKCYNKVAKKFDEKYCKTIYYKEPLDKFLNYLKKGNKVLDVGCGTGHVAKYLSERGFIVTGIDLSESMVNLSRERAPNANFKVMDLRKMDFKPNFFDAILCLFSLIHVNDKECKRIVEYFPRILKNNGFLFLGLIEGSGEEIEEEHLDPSQKIYFNYYSKDFIRKVLTENNFEVLSIEDRIFKDDDTEHKEFFVIAKKS